MRGFSYRDSWVEVSLDHIKSNLVQFRNHVNQSVKIMAVVKADGYGHGAIEAAKAAISAGAEYLAVAILDEAVELREAGITESILVLGFTPPRSIKQALLSDIALTIFTDEVLEEVIEQSFYLNKKATIHIKIDTGMTRIGVNTSAEALKLAQKAAASEMVNLEGVYTHFASADNEDASYTKIQFDKFLSIIHSLEDNGIHFPIKHCCNSAAAMKFKEMHLDMVRIGIALYGLYPSETLKGQTIRLKQAMSFKTRIAAIKRVPADQPLSYGCTWSRASESMIATLPLGYADGLSRQLSNRGKVVINGQLAQIAGRVCMDQTMVDVSHIKECSLGDEVTIFGYEGGTFQSIDEIATLMNTINYEAVCLIGKRVPRIYEQKSIV